MPYEFGDVIVVPFLTTKQATLCSGQQPSGVSKRVPQRLKPSRVKTFMARLKPCPSCRVSPHLRDFLVRPQVFRLTTSLPLLPIMDVTRGLSKSVPYPTLLNKPNLGNGHAG
jgi:hypothetical protein